MKVKELAQPVKAAGRHAAGGLAADQDILTLEAEQLAALPAVIPVRDFGGEVIATVDRDVLLYCRHSCRDWLLARILDRHHDGVIAIDPSGRIFYVNDAYCRIIGVAKHQVLGKYLQKIEPGAAMLTVLATGRPIRNQAVHVQSVHRDVNVNIHPIERDGTLAGVVSFFRDVTIARHLSQELVRAKGLADYFRQDIDSKDGLPAGFRAIIGEHPSFLKALSQAMIVARTDASVLLYGENGVGKEIVAQAIHHNSGRSDKPLVSVNCAAIPESLLESELFGYEEGSFTGARRGGKPGKFKLADGGTIFLDEVGDMSPSMQSKLLRVLQDKEIETIGRTRSVPVDVRVIAATNRDLEDMVRRGLFRTDLYYRLNVVFIRIPPLRERGGDIALLADHFLGRFNAKYRRKLVLTDSVRAFFAGYHWPGNVRELQNCLEYAVIMGLDREIRPEHLPVHLGAAPQDGVGETTVKPASATLGSWRDLRQATEKELIEKTLAACGNNKTATMNMLGISRRAFYRKLKDYGLFVPK